MIAPINLIKFPLTLFEDHVCSKAPANSTFIYSKATNILIIISKYNNL